MAPEVAATTGLRWDPLRRRLRLRRGGGTTNVCNTYVVVRTDAPDLVRMRCCWSMLGRTLPVAVVLVVLTRVPPVVCTVVRGEKGYMLRFRFNPPSIMHIDSQSNLPYSTQNLLTDFEIIFIKEIRKYFPKYISSIEKHRLIRCHLEKLIVIDSYSL